MLADVTSHLISVIILFYIFSVMVLMALLSKPFLTQFSNFTFCYLQTADSASSFGYSQHLTFPPRCFWTGQGHVATHVGVFKVLKN